jgi:hypothetical protein
MKLSEMSADEAKEKLYNAYMGAHENFDSDNDEHGQHPSRDYRRWTAIAATGGQNSEKQIEPNANDNPPPTEGTPQPPVAGNDSAERIADDMIRLSGHPDIAGQLALASARRSSPARIKAMDAALRDPAKTHGMASAIPGYNRLK